MQNISEYDIVECYNSEDDPNTDKAWLPGLYPGIVAGLIGDSGVGKSWFSLLLAHAWALESNLTGLPIIRHGRVGVLSLEEPRRTVSARLRTIRPHLTNPQVKRVADRLIIWDGTNEAQEDWAQRVLSIKKLASQVDLLLIDHLRRLHPFEENSNKEMATVMGDLQIMAGRTHTTILMLQRAVPSRVPPSAQSVLRAQGSSVVQNTWRWCGSLSRLPGSTVEFRINQARYGPSGIALARFAQSPENGWLETLPTPNTKPH